jgi:hypothetical protein
MTSVGRMTSSQDLVSDLKVDLLARLGTGRAFAMKASALGEELGISPRMVGAIVSELIDDGYAIGSSVGERPGYFLCASPEDVEAGGAHIIARAKGSLHRYYAFRKAAASILRPDQLELIFDLGAGKMTGEGFNPAPKNTGEAA